MFSVWNDVLQKPWKTCLFYLFFLNQIVHEIQHGFYGLYKVKVRLVIGLVGNSSNSRY